MKGELNRDWYCVTNYNRNTGKGVESDCYGQINNTCNACIFNHRKWPTPEQFKEEYGDDWKGGVYIYFDFKSEFESKWELRWYYERGYFPNSPIVCACTPWGKPPNDWRPE